jgi:hypothetical protein
MTEAGNQFLANEYFMPLLFDRSFDQLSALTRLDKSGIIQTE